MYCSRSGAQRREKLLLPVPEGCFAEPFARRGEVIFEEADQFAARAAASVRREERGVERRGDERRVISGQEAPSRVASAQDEQSLEVHNSLAVMSPAMTPA